MKAELIPVIPILAGSTPIGIRNKVYIIIWKAWKSMDEVVKTRSILKTEVAKPLVPEEIKMIAN